MTASRQHKDFTETASLSICNMIATLCEDDYQVIVEPGPVVEIDGERVSAYNVSVIETDGSVMSRGSGYYLDEALQEAYIMTPEGKNRERLNDGI